MSYEDNNEESEVVEILTSQESDSSSFLRESLQGDGEECLSML